jgi:hypothetical protein
VEAISGFTIIVTPIIIPNDIAGIFKIKEK